MHSVGNAVGGCFPTDGASVGCVVSRGGEKSRKKRSKGSIASEMAVDPDATSSAAKSHHHKTRSVIPGEVTPPSRTPNHPRSAPLPQGLSTPQRPGTTSMSSLHRINYASRRNSTENGTSSTSASVIPVFATAMSAIDGGVQAGGGGERSPPGELRSKGPAVDDPASRSRSWSGEKFEQENGGQAVGTSDGSAGGSGSSCETRTIVAGVIYKWVNFGRGYRPRWFVLDKGVLYYYKVHGPEKVNISVEKMRRGELITIGEEALKMERKEKQLSTEVKRSQSIGFSSDLKKLAKIAQQQGLFGAATLASGVHVVTSGVISSGQESTEHTREFKTAKSQGQVHLPFANLRESQSDEKKFYICTGSKTMHLIAESKEDRTLWMEQLQMSKERYGQRDRRVPLGDLEDSLKQTLENVRATLLDAAVSEDIISICEGMVKSEMMVWQLRLEEETAKREQLQKTLRNLEVEKIELETTVVDGEQTRKNRMKQIGGRSRSVMIEKSEMLTPLDDDDCDADGTSTDTDDDGKREGMETTGMDTGDSDEDNDEFFEAVEEFFVPSELRKVASKRFIVHPIKEGREERGEGAHDTVDGVRVPGAQTSRELSAISLDSEYPLVERRKRLPEPKQKEKSVSLWSIIKENVGKDLTRVCLPVYFNEPLSALQRAFEELEYSYLLDRAYKLGKQGDSEGRLLNVAAFAVSGYAATEGRMNKPFNPLLGETYEADRPEQGMRFFAEKVSHHPTIVACHCDGRGWKFWGDSNLKSKFWGRSIQVDPVGILTLQFDDGEIFTWSKVTSSIYNIIIGKLYIDHYGTMRIQGNRDLSCKLKFKEQSIIDRNPHQVKGLVTNSKGDKLATLIGKWDESMYYVKGDIDATGKDLPAEAKLLWKRNPPAEHPTRYGLTSFAISLNELTPGLKKLLPPTDSRLRPDQRCLEEGLYDEANNEKLRLELKQRQARKLQETGWQPRWFVKEPGSQTFRYKGGYWEARDQNNFTNCQEIFGPDPQSMQEEGL